MDAETDGETEGKGAMSESDFEIASTLGHGPGESTHGGRAVQRQAAGRDSSWLLTTWHPDLDPVKFSRFWSTFCVVIASYNTNLLIISC